MRLTPQPLGHQEICKPGRRWCHGGAINGAMFGIAVFVTLRAFCQSKRCLWPSHGEIWQFQSFVPSGGSVHSEFPMRLTFIFFRAILVIEMLMLPRLLHFSSLPPVCETFREKLLLETDIPGNTFEAENTSNVLFISYPLSYRINSWPKAFHILWRKLASMRVSTLCSFKDK